MTDAQLVRTGKACRYMCNPKNSANGTVESVFELQLAECKAEYRRRHPKEANANTDETKVK